MEEHFHDGMGMLAGVLSLLIQWQARILFLGVPLILLLRYVVYPLSPLHPLSHIPGPALARLSPLVSLYHAILGDKHHWLHHLHLKYGPKVLYRPSAVSFNTSSALRTIYSHDANTQKAKFYKVFLKNKNSESIHSAIDKAQHARKRRIVSLGFGERQVRQMEPYILEHVDGFLEHIRPKTSSKESNSRPASHDMAKLCGYLTFDIMGELAYGRSFDMLASSSQRFVLGLIDLVTKRTYITGNLPVLHHLGLDRFLFPSIVAAREQYFDYSMAQLQQRQALDGSQKSKRKDLFQFLLDARDPETGEKWSTEELWAESRLILTAGSDTTSSALSSIFYYLTCAENKPALSTLQAEIRSTFSSLDEIRSGLQLQSCVYLRGVIDEALRLSSPVAGTLPREAMRGGITIDGDFYPEGMEVGVSIYGIHHNAEYFPDPYVFRPERWIKARAGDESWNAAERAFSAFSTGNRGCMGKRLAYLEMSLTIARCVFVYDFSRAQQTTPDPSIGLHGEYAVKDWFTSSTGDGPHVFFELRTPTTDV